MSHPVPYPIGLANEITRQLHLLADRLAQLPPQQATLVIARVLDPDDGLLDGVTGLLSVSSTFAKGQAERGVLPAEVWLALGRATNDLDAIGEDLDEHRTSLRRLGTQPATGSGTPPTPAPLVVRRHR
ncbi:hypothetical protein K388_02702 [Streptomyces sp. KhCrAH-43]|uniref:hypothetical protein n=1 Tax=unclassified Streptomyces TaxID=2593676 RepID=UPI000372B509|nr:MULTISPECIES: hypothetical protein [unclassified Streptomyces]MYS36693.1 hypothetical protein [Streptomyces sp. SID4920]MYX69164.1 hypothetical protein [Streptomyces sp. SID8373]RAJ62016.1 hypothetical protein K388_02702 [Streptomyces sp. KhCrAH-43]